MSEDKIGIEVVEELNDIIAKQSSLIDKLYCLLSQHMEFEELVSTVAPDIEKIAAQRKKHDAGF